MKRTIRRHNRNTLTQDSSLTKQSMSTHSQAIPTLMKHQSLNESNTYMRFAQTTVQEKQRKDKEDHQERSHLLEFVPRLILKILAAQ
jgi:hypothetical protein